MNKVKINKSIAAMGVSAQGRVTRDPSLQAEVIAKRADVDLALVRAVIRDLPIPMQADDSALTRLLAYFEGGAAKPRTPEPNRVLMGQWVAVARRHLDARQLERDLRESTVVSMSALATGASSTRERGVSPPSPRAEPPAPRTAAEDGRQVVLLADTWADTVDSRPRIGDLPAAAMRDLLVKLKAGGKLQEAALVRTRRSAKGPAAMQVRLDADRCAARVRKALVAVSKDLAQLG